MVVMLSCSNISDRLRRHLAKNIAAIESAEGCRLVLPWKDSLGEPITFGVSRNGSAISVDDDGTLFFAIGRTTLGQSRQERSVLHFVEEFLNHYGIRWNDDDQVAELTVDSAELEAGVSHFIQVVTACFMALPVIVERPLVEKEPPTLGRRLATRLNQEIKTWIHATTRQDATRRADLLKRVKRRYLVSGSEWPVWQVDFFYQPQSWLPRMASNPVVVLAVDLDVNDPRAKAEHAAISAIDISKAGHGYTIRIAVAAHGRNGSASAAKGLIREAAGDVCEFYDLDHKSVNRRFLGILRSEIIGEPLVIDNDDIEAEVQIG